MIISGAGKIPLRVGNRSVNSEILVTPDLNGLIIGIDWLEKQGQFVWNFRDGRIKFEDGEWIELKKEEESRRMLRVYVSEDTLIPALGNVETNVRVTHRTAEDTPFIRMMEQCEVPFLDDIVYTRSLLPARFVDIRISLVNLGDEHRIVPNGTYLGRLYEAEVISFQEENTDEASQVRRIKSPDPNELEPEIIQ